MTLRERDQNSWNALLALSSMNKACGVKEFVVNSHQGGWDEEGFLHHQLFRYFDFEEQLGTIITMFLHKFSF